MEPSGVQLDRYHLHDLEGVTDQRPDGNYPSFERTEKAAPAAVAGHLIVDISADPGGPARRKMLIDIPLEMELIPGLVIRRGVDVVERDAERTRDLEPRLGVEVGIGSPDVDGSRCKPRNAILSGS